MTLASYSKKHFFSSNTQREKTKLQANEKKFCDLFVRIRAFPVFGVKPVSGI